MKTYLEDVAERLATEDPTVVVWKIGTAFEEAIATDPAWASPHVRGLFDLVRFCKFDAIAPWLKNERSALAHAAAFARKIGDLKLAGILDDTLQGKTQGDVSFSVNLPGQELRVLEVDVGEVTRFDGKDWGGTDIALSFAMDDLRVGTRPMGTGFALDSSRQAAYGIPLHIQKRSH